MKRQVVMIVDHKGDHYEGVFPDYHAMGSATANDAATLLTKGVEALNEEIARRGKYGVGMKAPRTLSAHVFGGPSLVGKFLTVVEADFPG